MDSKDSILGRLAVLSIANEGRGLDTGQGMVQKLYALGDREGGDLVKSILKDEENHVRVGLEWFERLSELGAP